MTWRFLTFAAHQRPFRLRAGFGRLFNAILAAGALSRSRKGLARLDDHILRDIGLSRTEAEAEASRPVWLAPLHWLD